MKTSFKKSHIAVILILLVLIIDQTLKFYIKTNFFYGEGRLLIPGVEWFRLNFVENEGMAFGMTFGGSTGKVLLTLFRIVAVFFIGYYMAYLIKKKARTGLVISMALIFAGAMGNIIDSVFYGLVFSESDWHIKNVAEFMPEGGGYAGLLHGRVVDMLYFPLIEGYWPQWVPVVGGEHFLFFRPVFNIADSAITTGVLMILVFQKRYFAKETTDTETKADDKDQAVPEGSADYTSLSEPAPESSAEREMKKDTRENH